MNDYVSPRFDSIALVSIDMQRDVLDGQEQEVVGTSAAAKVIADLRDAFRRVGAPIVHIVRYTARTARMRTHVVAVPSRPA